jgi:uncharacterized OB-fold protein
MSESLEFPYPIPEYGTEPYWEACNNEQLIMQRCTKCSKFRWHPAPLCTHCGADDFSWEAISGRGKITTWTVVTHPVHPAAFERVPYVVVEVELDEQPGLRMLSNLVDAEDEDIVIDAGVAVEFTTHSNGQKLPVFRLSPD